MHLGGYRDVMAIFKKEDSKTLRIGTALKFANKEYKVSISEPVAANDLQAIADKLEELNGPEFVHQ